MEQTKRTGTPFMAKFSLFLGILALLSIFNISRTIFLACMSILLACLSRGGSFKMPEKAVSGFVISVIAVIATIALTAFAIYLMIDLFGMETVSDPIALQEALTELYNQLFSEMTAGGMPL